MPSSDEEEEIYDGEDFHAALLACPAVVGDLVNTPVALLTSGSPRPLDRRRMQFRRASQISQPRDDDFRAAAFSRTRACNRVKRPVPDERVGSMGKI